MESIGTAGPLVGLAGCARGCRRNADGAQYPTEATETSEPRRAAHPASIRVAADEGAYLSALAADLLAAGGRLELGRTVVGVEPGARVEVRCEDGWRVEASDVVLATHMPALLRTLAFAEVEQRRHYAMAGVVAEIPPTSYDVSAGWSTRPIHGRTEPWAVVVGGGHPTGTGNPTASLHSLRVFAERNLHMDVRHSWSTQDAFSTDLLPLVGRAPVGGRGVWFATGFAKLGGSAS